MQVLHSETAKVIKPKSQLTDPDNNQSAVGQRRPIEKVVQHGLLPGDAVVQLVHEEESHNAIGCRSSTSSTATAAAVL